MATGGYRGSGAATTDFLEEWKAKREKMRAKQAPPAGVSDGKVATNIATSGSGGSIAAAELNNNNGSGGMNCVPLARSTPKEPQPTAGTRAGGAEPPGSRTSAAPTSPEEEKVASKGKGSSGPSARKGKGQIEKRKLREKRRSTGVVNIPATEVSRRWVKRAGAGEEGAAQPGRRATPLPSAAPELPGGLRDSGPSPSLWGLPGLPTNCFAASGRPLE